MAVPRKTKKSPKARAKICRGRPVTIDETRVFQVAEDLFSRLGFDGTTTREVARKAGCNLALISYHFGGKEGLYRTMIQSHLGRLSERLQDAMAQVSRGEKLPDWVHASFSTLAERRFYAAIEAIAEMLIGNGQMQKVVCREMMSGNKSMASVLSKSENSLYRILKATIEGLQKEGVLNPDMEVKIAVVSLIGPMIYTCVGAPILKTVYQIGELDASYRQKLCVYLTQSFFAQHAKAQSN